MMSRKEIIVLMSVFSLVACGKSQVEAVSGESGKPSGAGILSVMESPGMESATLTDGTLGPLSDYDLKDDALIKESGLPFLDKGGVEKSFSTFKHRKNGTAKVRSEKQGEISYSVHSNLVFRAIRQLPPRTAILDVTAFKLRLSRVVVHAKKDQKPEEGQVLCLLDGRVCAGSRPESNQASKEGESGTNPKFWSDAMVYPGDFFKSSRLSEISSSEDGVVYSAGKELEIDLMEVFHLARGASAVDFLFKHSEAYSLEESGFRKFRFALGDRVLADGGELILEFETNAKAVPEGYEKRVPRLKHGARDMVNFESKERRVIRNIRGRAESEYIRILGPNDLKDGSAAKLSSKLAEFEQKIESVRVVALASGKDTLELAEELKQDLVKAGFSASKVIVVEKVEEGAGNAVGISVKFVPLIEESATERNKIMEELLGPAPSADESAEPKPEVSSEFEDIQGSAASAH
jgi:hypothetical protein